MDDTTTPDDMPDTPDEIPGPTRGMFVCDPTGAIRPITDDEFAAGSVTQLFAQPIKS